MTRTNWPKKLLASSIFFDLDDTLIDTSGSITPRLLEKALKRMIQNGLEGTKKGDDLLHMLLQVHQTASSSQETICRFLKLVQAPSALEKSAMEVFYIENFDFTPQLLPGAIEVLTALCQRVRVHLITIGDPNIQQIKLEKAGISQGFFSTIDVCEKSKEIAYRRLIEDFSYTPSDVVVCGDRIERDLVPAKALGCQTVQMRWGRGLQQEVGHPSVDLTISGLKTLLEAVEFI